MAIINYSQTQSNPSYTLEFQAESDEYIVQVYPDSYLIFTIYKNGDEYYVSPQLEQATPFSVTFNEVSSANVTYEVVYRVYSNLSTSPLVDASGNIEFTVYEYQPTFILPVVTCAELGKPFSFYPTDWNQNGDNVTCPNPGETLQIEYKRYEFNINNSTYELKDTNTRLLNGETGPVIGSDYEYQVNNATWVPDKLAMVKFVVTVTNCSTSVEKSTVFPICGSWKIRRLSCGNYRIYNYKNSSISYSLYNNVTDPATLIKTEQIGPFTYVELNLENDGVYRVTSGGVTQFIFNFCTLENCVLDLQKKILMDECFCDSCKRDKDLYQKAMRMLPLYETWKKLLDKDGVYDMQYKTTDLAGELARIYDAQELYLELSKLCESCGDISKKCGC